MGTRSRAFGLGIAGFVACGGAFGLEAGEPPLAFAGDGAPSAESVPPPQDDAAGVEAHKHAAKDRFLRGLELVQNDHWDAALAEFLASRALFPTRAALKNAAVCLRQLGRFAESLDMYRELVGRFADSIPPDERATIDEAMAQLALLVGEVTVTTRPDGAVVIVDGIERGQTPGMPPLTVNAGTHTIRVYREGFVPLEVQVHVAGKERKSLSLQLRPIARAGRLVVTEVAGERMKVVVDGAVVGSTPWTGVLEEGAHTVFLRGDEDHGTMPSRATVTVGQTTTLTLRAVKLDTELAVEPVPSNARVDIDGIPVGQGYWLGRLTSGRHTVEVSAEGFLASRRDVALAPSAREVMRIALDRDMTDPRWKEAFRTYPYVGAWVGGGWAPGFGGSSDSACSRSGCSKRLGPIGIVAGIRGGLQLAPEFGVELAIGYLRLSQSSTRKHQTASADFALQSSDYEDTIRLSGPLAALSGTYRPSETWPGRFRLWLGAMRGAAAFTNAGTFRGTAVNPANPADTAAFSVPVSVPESDARIWVPFVGPEARASFRVSPAVELDAGLAFWVMFAPATPRTGRSARDQARQQRSAHLPDIPGAYADSTAAQPGVAYLEQEHAFGTILLFLPSIGGRLNL
jgi:hypothetical protein